MVKLIFQAEFLKTLDELLRDAEIAHGHLCAGQVLGVRLAMRGLELLGIDDPHGKDRKRLITFVEIDRCATDAVGVVTGCRLGKRALKFRDWGKVAATFVDLTSAGRSGYARKKARRRWRGRCIPRLKTRTSSRCWPIARCRTSDLFTEQWVKVTLPPEELPGYKGERIVCAECGEGINFQREVRRDGAILCRACAGERYYEEI